MPQTILIADDEAHIRLVVGQRLRALGYTVIEGCDGQEALELAKEHRPQLVLTDLQMPGMSGIELCTHLKKAPETAMTPAILLTARGYLLSQAELDTTNVREILSKPFSVREVAERIARHLPAPEADLSRLAA